MKITRVDQFSPRQRTRLVRITTDSGIEGWGESTLEGKHLSVPAAIEEFSGYLIGKDPLRIEHHWQQMYRSSFFRGGAHNMSAIAGIDAALWDIAGKHYGVPSYMLLGGNVRDRIRVYAHWGIRDMSEESLEQARNRLEMLSAMGYTAYKAGPPGFWRAHEPPSRIDEFVEMAFTMREWVGDDVELCFDFHGKMAPGIAIEVCNELKGMRPMFVEEPVPQENEDALKLVSDHVPFPIATGERLLSRWEFRRIIEQQCVSLLQPDRRPLRRYHRVEENCQLRRGLLPAHHAALCHRPASSGRMHDGRCGGTQLLGSGAGRSGSGQRHHQERLAGQ